MELADDEEDVQCGDHDPDHGDELLVLSVYVHPEKEVDDCHHYNERHKKSNFVHDGGRKFTSFAFVTDEGVKVFPPSLFAVGAHE